MSWAMQVPPTHEKSWVGPTRTFVATKGRGGIVGPRIRSGKPTNYSAGVSDGEHIRRQVAHDNAAGTYDSVVADAYARADDTRSAEPNIVTDSYGFRSLESAASRMRIERMERGIDVNPRPDLGVIADANGIAIQEDATVIDETPVPNVDVPPVVATERRLDLRRFTEAAQKRLQHHSPNS
jgi:hypothetical protein